jgi:hypothetical protein
MRFIAGALVVLAGSLMRGMAVLAVADGNRGTVNIACWGGFIMVCFGIAVILAAHQRENDK